MRLRKRPMNLEEAVEGFALNIKYRAPLKIQSSPKCKAQKNFAAPHMRDM